MHAGRLGRGSFGIAMADESDVSSTDVPTFDLRPMDELGHSAPPPFARRYFAQYNNNSRSNNNNKNNIINDDDFESSFAERPTQAALPHARHAATTRADSSPAAFGHQRGRSRLSSAVHMLRFRSHSAQSATDSSGVHENNNNAGDELSEPDLNTKWSWKNLKREFKLTHSEDLFHLYQAKLQHSFFVALLILNIIFNMGAIFSYAISKYHEMNLYLAIMRLAAIAVFVAFLVLIWFDKLWMQSKFSRTVASLAVLSAMIFGEASKFSAGYDMHCSSCISSQF